MGRFIIQSHRGAGNLGPENTLESFKLAWSIGTVPEADVRVTKDGVFVAFHDDTFSRLVSGASEELRKLTAADLTWEELSQLDVGSWKGERFKDQHPPRLSDVFETMRGRPERHLYLDIKDASLPDLAALAREHDIIRQVILASTHYALIREWSDIAPESQTLLWMGGDEARLAELLQELLSLDFKGVTQLQFHVRVGDLRSDDPFTPSSAFIRESAAEITSRGILFQTLPLGSDSVEAYHRLLDLGVQSFATDYPTVALQAVRGCGKGRGEHVWNDQGA